MKILPIAGSATDIISSFMINQNFNKDFFKTYKIRVTLEKHPATEKDFIKLLETLALANNVKIFSIEIDLTPKLYEILFFYLKHIPTISSLALPSNIISNYKLGLLSDLIKSHPRLREVSLANTNTNIDNNLEPISGYIALFNALCENQNIISLILPEINRHIKAKIYRQIQENYQKQIIILNKNNQNNEIYPKRFEFRPCH